MTSEEKVKIIVGALDSKKAKDIKVIKVDDLTTVTDYFVVATGSSTTNVKALSDEAEYKMKEAGYYCSGVEGYDTAGWILLDFTDVVVNVFTGEQREFYSLERLWKDGTEVDAAEFLK